MNSRAIHIHLGPSKLALGLILPVVFEIGIPSHVIARAGKDSRPAYGVSLAPDHPLQYYPLASFKGPVRISECHPDILRALTDGRPALITATLRGGIAGRYPFVRELLEARRGAAETIFLACENSPDPLYASLREEFEPAGIQFPATVVNRICPKFLDPDLGRRVVRGHELGEWLIERPRPGALAAALESAELVSYHDTIDGLEKRKRWVVNGGQLYLAILAHEAMEQSLVEAANTPGLRDLVNHFHSETIRVLRSAHPELPENLKYCVDHCIAFCEVADDVPRMVAMQRADLMPFFKTLRRRIGEPAALGSKMSGGQTPEVFLQLFGAVDSLLEREAAYDWGDPADPGGTCVINAEVDKRAIDEYAAMLDGCLPPDEIELRRRRLEIILRSHRSQNEPQNHRLKPL